MSKEKYLKFKEYVKKQGANPWAERPNLKNERPWNYMRVQDWSEATTIAMEDYELGFWSCVNQLIPIEGTRDKPEVERPTIPNETNWSIVETIGKDPYWKTDFFGGDRKDIWLNLKEQIGPDWFWYDKHIEYRLNKQGFRNPLDLEKYDWENSYVIVGCSHIFGVGNAWGQTIGELISKKLNAPVINLGVGGTGNNVMMHNVVHAIQKFGKPKGLFVLWTYTPRHSVPLSYQQKGVDAHDSWYDPVWQRVDILPGQDDPDKVNKEISYYPETLQTLEVNASEFVPNPRHFYRRTMARETFHAIMGKENVFELCAEFPGWIWREDSENSKPVSLRKMVPEWSHDIVINCIENRKREPEKFKPWHSFSKREQMFILNKCKARDIDSIDPELGPIGGHWGPLMQKYYAKKFIELFYKIDRDPFLFNVK